MAAAAIAARAAMMNQGDDVVERTDEELLAEVRPRTGGNIDGETQAVGGGTCWGGE